MQLTTEQLPDGIERITLAGRMDLAGTQAIDLRFTSLTTTRPALTPQSEPTLEDAPVGGWGLPIVRHFSDELHYRRLEGRNLLTLTFRL